MRSWRGRVEHRGVRNSESPLHHGQLRHPRVLAGAWAAARSLGCSGQLVPLGVCFRASRRSPEILPGAFIRGQTALAGAQPGCL